MDVNLFTCVESGLQGRGNHEENNNGKRNVSKLASADNYIKEGPRRLKEPTVGRRGSKRGSVNLPQPLFLLNFYASVFYSAGGSASRGLKRSEGHSP